MAQKYCHGFGQPKVRPLDAEDLQGRLHADEDAEEQDGDLDDRPVVEAVCPPRVPGPDGQRQPHQRQLNDLPQVHPRMPVGARHGFARIEQTHARGSRRATAGRSAKRRRIAAGAGGFRRGQRRRLSRAGSTNSDPTEDK